MSITHGGDAATATGYVVYRCQTLDGCTVNGNAGVNGSAAFETQQTGSLPNYVQVDGFVLAGSAVNNNFAIGLNIYNSGSTTVPAAHHIWLLNSIVHGFSQSGVQTGGADYQYFIHNTTYGNATSTTSNCGAQGSGISVFQSLDIPGYTPTADDMTNPNPLLGPTWQVGSAFFHFVIEYNVVYNNALTQCGTADTDGNGIILDSNAGLYGNPTSYSDPMLVAFNVVYNNGGGGIHNFVSTNITVANNTCFNNYLDPKNTGTWRGCIDDEDSTGSTYINNIAVGIPTTGNLSCNSAVLLAPAQSPVSTWLNNLTDMIGAGCNGEIAIGRSGDTYSAPPNFESTTPGWVNVGTSSVGTESTAPVGTNFALAPGSAAIGKGLTKPYLPASSVDLGACASALTTCP